MTRECFLSQKESESFRKKHTNKDFIERHRIMQERAKRRQDCALRRAK